MGAGQQHVTLNKISVTNLSHSEKRKTFPPGLLSWHPQLWYREKTRVWRLLTLY
jgi:hypothetical protein